MNDQELASLGDIDPWKEEEPPDVRDRQEMIDRYSGMSTDDRAKNNYGSGVWGIVSAMEDDEATIEAKVKANRDMYTAQGVTENIKARDIRTVLVKDNAVERRVDMKGGGNSFFNKKEKGPMRVLKTKEKKSFKRAIRRWRLGNGKSNTVACWMTRLTVAYLYHLFSAARGISALSVVTVASARYGFDKHARFCYIPAQTAKASTKSSGRWYKKRVSCVIYYVPYICRTQHL